jgi:hypothetical protein
VAVEIHGDPAVLNRTAAVAVDERAADQRVDKVSRARLPAPPSLRRQFEQEIKRSGVVVFFKKDNS